MLLIGMLVPSRIAAVPHFNDAGESQDLATRLVEAMENKEALGQVLMFGYPGEIPDPNTLEWILNAGLGGIKVFGWNAGDLNRLAETISEYQQAALSTRWGIPLLIATDQEGGWVRHIKGQSSITPGNMALGADPVPADSLETGRIIGRELAAVGVNMNFAPTVDVFVDSQADVIGPRAFMANPHWTGILGLAFAKGQQEFGIISTAKHFPGHGDTQDDSHGTLPVVYAEMNTLRQRDLVPYRTMIDSGLPAIMIGHLAFPELAGDMRPATQSSFILNDLLRDEMGFKGVAITDDLFMWGARSDGSMLHEVCYRAMQAGSDLLLISQGPHNYQSIHQRLMKEMEKDPSFNRRVRQAAQRVVAMKLEWLKGDNAVPLNPDLSNTVIPAPGTHEFLLTQAARSITLVRSGRFPVPPYKAGQVLLVGSRTLFFSEGLRRYPEAHTWYLPYEFTQKVLPEHGRELAQTAQNYDTIIAMLPDKNTAILLNELQPLAEKVLLLSVLSPAHLEMLGWAQTSLAAYGTGKESFRMAFAAIAGDFVPEGRLPIPLNFVP